MYNIGVLIHSAISTLVYTACNPAMDPILLHTASHQAVESKLQTRPFSSESPDPHQGSDESEDTLHPLSADPSKRPRLRLAHACDRCRKRKIRCDTHQPCAPCLASRHECTFMAPSRRVTVKESRTSVKRPRSPGGQTALEARLAALESMLGDVPPKVHNAFLASLDARLGSGTGVGIKEGKGEGVEVAFEALSGGSAFLGSGNLGEGSTPNWTNGLDAIDGDWGPSTRMPNSNEVGRWQGGNGSAKRKEEEGVNEMARRMEGMSFFYEDEIGQAKWQGESFDIFMSGTTDETLTGATSGFPLLSILTAANTQPEAEEDDKPSSFTNTCTSPSGDPSPLDIPTARRAGPQPALSDTPASFGSGIRSTSSEHSENKKERFFPDRTPRPHQTLNPEASWKVITGVIPPDLMDTLVRCYLSTSHLLWPFLHAPSFLQDYAKPAQWGEPGFACFIVAVCTLSSRHVDDLRVRANPQDPSTAGKQYFELFKRLRDLPSADRPTLYSIQAAFLAAVYAFGLGNLSKAFALQAESITLCLDGGLHRSVDGYDHFDAVEKETRKVGALLLLEHG